MVWRAGGGLRRYSSSPAVVSSTEEAKGSERASEKTRKSSRCVGLAPRRRQVGWASLLGALDDSRVFIGIGQED